MDLAALQQIHGLPLLYLETVDSTNRVARELARQGWSGVVVADHQTAGRGRLGRSWEAAAGQNLLLSLVLRPALPPEQAARAVLVWAAAVAEALDLWVKWPNDLVDGQDHKLGGFLSELDADADRLRSIVLGLGINVNQSEFPGLPEASSLALLRGAPQRRVELLGQVVGAILAADPRGEDPLDGWRRRSRTLGRRVSVAGVEGLATGIRADGALMVDDVPVLTGDVSLITEG